MASFQECLTRNTLRHRQKALRGGLGGALSGDLAAVFTTPWVSVPNWWPRFEHTETAPAS